MTEKEKDESSHEIATAFMWLLTLFVIVMGILMTVDFVLREPSEWSSRLVFAGVLFTIPLCLLGIVWSLHHEDEKQREHEFKWEQENKVAWRVRRYVMLRRNI